MTKLETTTKIHLLLQNLSYDELAKKIGITKATLYVRVAKHNWKLAEIALIKGL